MGESVIEQAMRDMGVMIELATANLKKVLTTNNVSGYGTKGDGTDETDKIQDAIDAAIANGSKSVFFSPGAYSATSLDHLSDVVLLGDNATLTVGGTDIPITQLGDTTDITQNNYALSKYMQDIANGTAVIIECWGDSTYYGYDSATGLQVETPAPAQLQTVLRTYYGNSAATVINRGVSGAGTTYALNFWNEDMTASSAKIIFINYAINDMQGTGINAAISAEQYRENLRSMIKTARQTNKAVVLETPNPVLSGGTLGAQTKAEGLKQFAEVMRQVAREFSVPLVDSYKFAEDYFKQNNVITALPDGIHPSQAFYKMKGQMMASALISPHTAIIDGPMLIPAAGPAVSANGGVNGSFAATGSKSGMGRIAQNIRVPLYVSKPGMDLYIATPVWNVGSTACSVVFDTNAVATLSMRDYDFGGNFAVDQEILIAENVSPGFHLIEINSTPANGDCGLYYVRARNSNKLTTTGGNDSGGTAPLSSVKRTILQDVDVTVTGANGQHHILFDEVPTSRLIKNLDIEVKATFGSNDGFFIFGHPMSSNTVSPRGGLLVYLDGGTGKLTIGEGTETAYNLTTIGAVDLRNANHTYRIVVTTAGAVTLYVDEVSVGTYTQLKAHVGGFFGVYKYSAGTVTLDKVTIRN